MMVIAVVDVGGGSVLARGDHKVSECRNRLHSRRDLAGLVGGRRKPKLSL